MTTLFLVSIICQLLGGPVNEHDLRVPHETNTPLFSPPGQDGEGRARFDTTRIDSAYKPAPVFSMRGIAWGESEKTVRANALGRFIYLDTAGVFGHELFKSVYDDTIGGWLGQTEYMFINDSLYAIKVTFKDRNNLELDIEQYDSIRHVLSAKFEPDTYTERVYGLWSDMVLIDKSYEWLADSYKSSDKRLMIRRDRGYLAKSWDTLETNILLRLDGTYSLEWQITLLYQWSRVSDRVATRQKEIDEEKRKIKALQDAEAARIRKEEEEKKLQEATKDF